LTQLSNHPGQESRQLFAYLSILSSLLIGAMLIVAPWTDWWDSNYLLPAEPWIRALALNAFARGAVSGLGLLNILVAGLELHERWSEGSERD
jgi:hypothetical protein